MRGPRTLPHNLTALRLGPTGDWIMSYPLKIFAAYATAALAIATAPTEASAGDGGRVAAGLLGGFAATAIIGSAIAPLPYYSSPRYGWAEIKAARAMVRRP